jgi:hypothetical protein
MFTSQMKLNKRSQIIMELVILVGFAFLFSIAFIVAAGDRMKTVSDNKRLDTINDFGKSIKKEIDLASIMKEGYMREFTLPETIDGTIEYSIITKNSTLIINTTDYGYSSIIPKTNGTVAKGKNIIKKINNSVTIENA